MWDMYIAGEVGGMSESLARETVSNPDEKAKLLEAANCFDAPNFDDPLSKNNCQRAYSDDYRSAAQLQETRSQTITAENFWRPAQGQIHVRRWVV